MKQNGTDVDSTACIAQALAHPVRICILELLRNEGAYVMHLTSVLDRPQANISQHLAVLRDAGLVTDERDGMSVIYRVRDPRVFDIVERIGTLASETAAGRQRRGAVSPQGFGRGRVGAGRRGKCRCPRCSEQ